MTHVFFIEKVFCLYRVSRSEVPFGKGVACDALSLKRLPLVKEIPLLGEMSATRTKGSAASARRAQTDKKLRDCI